MAFMDVYGKRLQEALKHSKKSRQQLADAMGISVQGVGQVLRKGAFTAENNTLAANFLCVSSDWLAAGIGEMTIPEAVAIPAAHESTARYELREKTDEVEIQQFDAHGAMGHGLMLRDQPGVIRSLNVSQEWLQKNIRHCTSYQNLCIVTGFGDSMKGIFNSGDPLLLDRGVNTVEIDAVYFFRVGNEGFIKRLQRIPGPLNTVQIKVKSKNPDYDDWAILEGMDFEVFGRVLKVWQSEDF